MKNKIQNVFRSIDLTALLRIKATNRERGVEVLWGVGRRGVGEREGVGGKEECRERRKIFMRMFFFFLLLSFSSPLEHTLLVLVRVASMRLFEQVPTANTFKSENLSLNREYISQLLGSLVQRFSYI